MEAKRGKGVVQGGGTYEHPSFLHHHQIALRRHHLWGQVNILSSTAYGSTYSPFWVNGNIKCHLLQLNFWVAIGFLWCGESPSVLQSPEKDQDRYTKSVTFTLRYSRDKIELIWHTNHLNIHCLMN